MVGHMVTRIQLSVWLLVSLLSGASVEAATTSPSSKEAAMVINLKEVEIAQVAEAVAQVTGKNFVIDPRVKAKVSFTTNTGLQPNKLYQTFLSFLKVHGFAALENGDLVEIVPVNVVRDRAQRVGASRDEDDWVTQVISLKHVSANKLVALLRPLVANEGHLVANPDSNKLIVTDRSGNIARIKEVVSRVDVPFQHSYEVVQLNYLSAEEATSLMKTLNTGLDKELALVVAPDLRANRLILSGGEAQRMAARALLAQIDSPVQQQGRVQVIYLQYAKATDLAPILQNIAGAGATLAAAEQVGGDAGEPNIGDGGTKPVAVAKVAKKKSGSSDSDISIEADERMNAVVISAPPQLIATLREVIRRLDVRRAQVIIEAIIAEVSEEQRQQLGASWVAVGPNGAGVFSLDDSLAKIATGAATGGTGGALGSVSGTGVTAVVGESYGNDQGWGALLRALRSNTDNNILSTPSLVTMDNEEASMIVGQEVPFSTGSYAATGTTGTTGTIGSPFQTNSIRLEIEQSVSSLIPNSKTTLGSVDLVTSKREIKTNVLVTDGNLVVLGGLMDESESESLAKVPGLGDIPVLGALFSYKENTVKRKNLMVFLRPRIVRDDQLAVAYAASKYNKLQQQSEGLIERKQTNNRELVSPRLPLNVSELLAEDFVIAKRAKPAPVEDRLNMTSEPLVP
ncbi:MAG: type II secretion system protein GspD [Thiotrichales bacterium 12-47-6]|nr:MAG: type II secretion system protein GspD [Thiotrichales bacterium 12-47-6]